MSDSERPILGSMTIRPYTATDFDAARQCVVELQEVERTIDPRLRAGESMAVPYWEHVLQRCREARGQVFVAVSDGSVVGVVPFLRRSRSPSETTHRARTVSLRTLQCWLRIVARGLARRSSSEPRRSLGILVQRNSESASSPLTSSRAGCTRTAAFNRTRRSW